jgi:hypothetical protein
MTEPGADWSLDADFPWPTRGQKPFKDGAHWLGDAKVADDTDERVYRMPEAYKRAADLLIERAVNDRAHRDYLVYPVIFCYRHFLELQMKCFLHEYGELVDIGANWTDHELDKVWPSFREMLRRFGNGDEDAIQVVADCVADFAEVDPRSFNFRYPTGRKGKPLIHAIEHLDLLNLYNVMGSVSSFFMGLEGSLDERKEAQTSYDGDL